MNKKDTKEIKKFFLKKKVTAVLFIVTISVLFLLNIFNLYKEKPEFEINASAVEGVVNEKFYMKYKFIETFGYLQNLMGKSEENNFEFAKDDYGKLYNIGFITGPSDVTEVTTKMEVLRDKFKGTDTKVMSLMPPDKYIRGYTKLDRGIPYNYANETADNYLANLSELGIDYVDFREDILESSIKPNELFYNTDHHWKIATAFWAYTKLVDELNSHYKEDIDPDGYFRDKNNYNFITYDKSYLGSFGRKVGKSYAGYDDFELVYPKFSTSFTLKGETKGNSFSSMGRFEDALIANEVLKMDNLYDIQSDKYSSYVFGNQGLTRIHNNKMENGPKVLIIKDSLAVPFSAFLSEVCSDVYLIDPRYYDGDILEYVSSVEGLDYVFVMFQPADLTLDFFKW